MSSNELRQHFLEWRAPLRGAVIQSVAWDSQPDGPTFSNLRLSDTTKTVVDITAPTVGRKQIYLIRCKVVDSSGHIHETEPPVQLTVNPGGNF
jgi:hypothetical protein